MDSPLRFLIIQTAFIGDVILATSLIEKLRYHFPNAVLHFLVRKGNESLLQNNPHVNEVLIWDKKQQKYRGLFTLLQYIRQQRYDKIINLQRFGTTGLLTIGAGARETIGFDKNPFSYFFTRRISHRIGIGLHEVDRNTALVSWFTSDQVFRPKLYPATADYEKVAVYSRKPYICLAPTSVWITKQYPAEKWVELVKQVPTQLVIYLLGAGSDWNVCEQIREAAGRQNTINVAGSLSLLASAALMEGAVMNYVNDSAPLHLASAMNAPTTAIFCSTVPLFGFGPLADHSFIIQTTELLDCRPCNLHGRKKCPLKHFQCAYSIRTDQLTKSLEEPVG